MPIMPPSRSKPSAPLTFDLPVSLIAKIEVIRSEHDLDSASEAVRMALAKFDLDGFTSDVEEHTQISVRIDATTRTGLKRAAKAKDVSIGAILRAAVEAVPAKKKR
jgi:Arc/MetJ-type ribon-helix-helix transcriptional regulator